MDDTLTDPYTIEEMAVVEVHLVVVEVALIDICIIEEEAVVEAHLVVVDVVCIIEGVVVDAHLVVEVALIDVYITEEAVVVEAHLVVEVAFTDVWIIEGAVVVEAHLVVEAASTGFVTIDGTWCQGACGACGGAQYLLLRTGSLGNVTFTSLCASSDSLMKANASSSRRMPALTRPPSAETPRLRDGMTCASSDPVALTKGETES